MRWKGEEDRAGYLFSLRMGGGDSSRMAEGGVYFSARG